MRVVAAPDKFRGSASATEVAAAIADAVDAVGGSCVACPMTDGGEGFVEALGGANRMTIATGPLGDPVEAPWRLADRTAVIEMAAASGLALVEATGNDPLAASTVGTGELMAAALDAGATRVLIGVGGSASTDGGLGAIRSLYPLPRLRGIELVVACDVRTRFVDAAEVFAPQKGASAAQVELLRRRLERLADVYVADYGRDVRDLPGGGAAGGLAGGLAAIGAELRSGFDLVAEELELDEAVAAADLVITGEGYLDAQSFDGKVVGGVTAMARRCGVPVLAIVGDAEAGVEEPGPVLSLVEAFGRDRSFSDPLGCIRDVLTEHLVGFAAGASE